MHLPPAESCELGPKLQCLEEVLGSRRFRTYLSDLYTQLASFRQRMELYGPRSHEFERQLHGLSRERTIPSESLLWLLNEAQRCLPKREAVNDGNTSSPLEEAPPIKLSEYSLLFQHCGDLQSPETSVVVDDFTALLGSLPMERMTLMRHIFEHLADTRRGEGYRPPPDQMKVHRLSAALKLHSRHCSSDELRTAETWLDHLQTLNMDVISLRDFLLFHLAVSDATASEDAEFVLFVQRLWGFESSNVQATGRGYALLQLLENHSTRHHLLELTTRKKELLAKIPGALIRIRSTTALLEVELQLLRALTAPADLNRYLQTDDGLNTRLGGALTVLRELEMPGQLLTALPSFVSSLRDLQVLNLRDNRLEALPVVLGALKSLRRLDLSDNRLRDASFAQAETWSQLTALAELQLPGNSLTTLPSAIVALPKLETLDLSRNALRSIRGAVVKQWEGRGALVTLDLHANELTELPEDIRVLKATLRCLLLHGNRLTSVPVAAIAELKALERLSLSQNHLTGDCLASYLLPSRQRALLLAHNQLRVFPRLTIAPEGAKPNQSVNSSIESIDMRSNRLRSFPEWPALVLTHCQALHLQQNALRELPDRFFASFPALRTCELQNNQLLTIPEGITDCSLLQVLDVHGNCLQSLPKELPRLARLEVLNAVENQLADVPVEWHAFATQCGASRVLHTLALRRNPLRNKILKAVVEGSGLEGVLSMSTADDQICEGILKRLLDGLRDASLLLREPTHQSRGGSEDEEERSGRPKWRGVARDVNRYLEERLRAMQRSQRSATSASLTVEAKSFERLIRTLPFTCSKQELALLVQRFLAKEEDAEAQGKTSLRQQIDGLAFLQAIERFGRFRTLSSPQKRAVNSATKPVVDAVGPILQYLTVLHRCNEQAKQQNQAKRGDESEGGQQVKRNPLDSRLKVKLRVKSKASPTSSKQEADTRNRKAKSETDRQHEKSEGKSRADVISDRQRQRIQVLQQQLLDQRLLLLAHQTRAGLGRSTGSDKSGAILPAELALDQYGNQSSGADDDVKRTILVSVKCLPPQETEERQESTWRLLKASARLDFRLNPQDTVLHLKQQLEECTRVPVDHQILVAGAAHGTPAVRLRNAAALCEYAKQGNRWSLTLLIGQTLPLGCGPSAI
ncbi:hypothetical protein BBJ28_00011197 [Nothophytophthora sp. Chile5]|nr:hypothetical protein BBJ28_00011197 [Nothophytophthora sp. Chile5]